MSYSIGRARFPFRSAWWYKARRQCRGVNAISKEVQFADKDSADYDSATNWFFDVAPTNRVCYVNTGSTAGGDGTTNLTTGSTRAYASLNAALTAEQTSFNTSNVSLTIYCAGSVADTTNVTVSGFNTTITNYLKIIVDQTVRHAGVWSTSNYRLHGTFNAINVQNSYVTFEGLQVLAGASSNDNGHQGFSIGGSYTNITIRECIIRLDLAAQTTFGNTARGISGGTDAAGDRYLINNVIYDFSKDVTSRGIQTINHVSGKTYAYHNTSYSCWNGIEDGYSDIIAENNLVYACTSAFTGTFDATSDYNVTDAATAPGANSKISQTITFTDTAGRDFHTSDPAAQVANVLFADSVFPVTIDIDGQARPSSGSVFAGADESTVSAAPASLDDMGLSGFFGVSQ